MNPQLRMFDELWLQAEHAQRESFYLWWEEPHGTAVKRLNICSVRFWA